MASGYLRVAGQQGDIYKLVLTNYEVKRMFERMVQDWFGSDISDYNDFIKALLLGDLKAMNGYMNRVAVLCSVLLMAATDHRRKPIQSVFTMDLC